MFVKWLFKLEHTFFAIIFTQYLLKFLVFIPLFPCYNRLRLPHDGAYYNSGPASFELCTDLPR